MAEFPALGTGFCFMGAFLVVAALVLATAIRIVPETKRLSVVRLGRYKGEVGPGLVILVPFIDQGTLVDAPDQAAQTYD